MELLDEVDLKLLDLLAVEAKRPLSLLARDLGLAASSVSRRIARLQEEGILEFAPVLNYEQLGVSARAFVLGRFGDRNIEHKSVLARIQAHPNVVTVASLFGSWDIVTEVLARSHSELTSVVDFIRSQTGQIDVSTFVVASYSTKRPSISALLGVDRKQKLGVGRKLKRRAKR